MQALSQILIAGFPVLVIIAALKDVTSYTIPNWISGLLILLFAPAALAAGLPLGELGLCLAVGFGCLAAGMVMFALRWIGGGDAKLFAAAGLWLGLDAMPTFVLMTAVAGGLLALFLVAFRADWARAMMPAGPAWFERLREPKGDAPYGVAITFGALAAFPHSALFALATG